MATANEMIKRLEGINILKEVEDAFNSHSEEAADETRKRLYEGVRGDDSPITPYYTPLTKFLKAKKGQPSDRVTLFDKGDFYEGVEFKAEGENINSDSTDWKYQKLMEKYGLKTLQLHERSKAPLIPLWRVSIVTSISEQTGMKSLK